MASSSSTCSKCGATLREGAKFCRSCGTPTETRPVAVTCPTCKHANPLDSKFCRACGAAIEQRQTSPVAAAPTVVQSVSSASAPKPSPPGRAGRRTFVIAAVVVGVLVLGGGAAAVAVILSKNSKRPVGRLANSPQRSPSNASGAGTSVASGSGATTGQATSPSSTTTAAGASVDPHQDIAVIRQVLYQHHEDIVQGNFRAAWNLTSPQYQAQKMSQPGGYNAWLGYQKTLQPYLVPAGLQVSIVSWDPSQQVATVNLTGMGWTDPKSNCTSWQGITWVHYENGQWYYEPGYSISPQRRAQWQSRSSQLLGGTCHD